MKKKLYIAFVICTLSATQAAKTLPLNPIKSLVAHLYTVAYTYFNHSTETRVSSKTVSAVSAVSAEAPIKPAEPTHQETIEWQSTEEEAVREVLPFTDLPKLSESTQEIQTLLKRLETEKLTINNEKLLFISGFLAEDFIPNQNNIFSNLCLTLASFFKAQIDDEEYGNRQIKPKIQQIHALRSELFNLRSEKEGCSLLKFREKGNLTKKITEKEAESEKCYNDLFEIYLKLFCDTKINLPAKLRTHHAYVSFLQYKDESKVCTRRRDKKKVIENAQELDELDKKIQDEFLRQKSRDEQCSLLLDISFDHFRLSSSNPEKKLEHLAQAYIYYDQYISLIESAKH